MLYGLNSGVSALPKRLADSVVDVSGPEHLQFITNSLLSTEAWCTHDEIRNVSIWTEQRAIAGKP
jgi:hypothetical protein